MHGINFPSSALESCVETAFKDGIDVTDEIFPEELAKLLYTEDCNGDYAGGIREERADAVVSFLNGLIAATKPARYNKK